MTSTLYQPGPIDEGYDGPRWPWLTGPPSKRGTILMALDEHGNHVPTQEWIDAVNAVKKEPKEDGHGHPDDLAAAIAKADQK